MCALELLLVLIQLNMYVVELLQQLQLQLLLGQQNAGLARVNRAVLHLQHAAAAGSMAPLMILSFLTAMESLVVALV